MTRLAFLLFLLLIIGTRLATAADAGKKVNLCKAKPVIDWLTHVIASDIGVRDPYLVFQAGDPLQSQIEKREQAKPFGPTSPSLLFMVTPETLGVHMTSGVYSCWSGIDSRDPMEDTITGLVRLQERDSRNFFYRVGRISGRDELYIALADRTSYGELEDFKGFPPSITALEELIQKVETGTLSVDERYLKVKAYRSYIEWPDGSVKLLTFGRTNE